MSRHVFVALSINDCMTTARIMHLAASYWGFVWMSVHLGMHWNMILGVLGGLWMKKSGQLGEKEKSAEKKVEFQEF